MLANIVSFIINVVIILIIVRALLSWAPDLGYRYRDTARWIGKVTDPFIKPFQQIIPPQRLGGIDISPILAILVLSFLRRLVVSIL